MGGKSSPWRTWRASRVYLLFLLILLAIPASLIIYAFVSAKLATAIALLTANVGAYGAGLTWMMRKELLELESETPPDNVPRH